MPSYELPKTAGIRGDRDAPAAGAQSTPFLRLIIEKMGSQSGAELPYLLTEVGLKADSVVLIHDEAQAPSPQSAPLREQKVNRQLLSESS